jgi:cystathionine gamma-synthase
MTLRPETRIVALGRPAHDEEAPVNPPIHLSSTYVGTGDPVGRHTYARGENPTWDPFEEALADLEGAQHPALLFGSGLGAIASALSLVPVGGTLLLPRHTYPGTVGLAQDLAGRGLFTIEFFDIPEGGENPVPAVLATAKADTALLWLESPTNPMLEVSDLPAVLTAAHAAGVLSVVDNTFATPLVQRPLESGADVVVHSVTKYLAGHSDVVLGAALTSSDDLYARLRSYRTLHGAIAGPFESWLALRGLRTLSVRIERSQANATELAARLAQEPGVAAVRHPSLPSDPGHEVAARTMSGFGSVISICLTGGVEEADAFVRAVRLWTPATSLGGVESTLERRHRHPGESATVPTNLIRLSVGIEDVEDLWEDLHQALCVTMETL